MQGGVDNLGLYSYAVLWSFCWPKQRLMPGRYHASTWVGYPSKCGSYAQDTGEAYRATRGVLYLRGLCSIKLHVNGK